MSADDVALSRALAQAAGELLIAMRRDTVLSGRELGAAGDAVSQQLLSHELAGVRPHDAVLSEEAVDDEIRLRTDRVWIIDPLDGTREYSEGRDDWAVHVALWESGALVAGSVALPALGLVFDSAAPGDLPVPRPWLRIAVSRSRPPEVAARVAAELGAELVPMGSAGFKAMGVVRGEVDAYVHAGGQYEWDSAAPVVVAAASGLWTSRLDGSALRYNQRNPYLPDLLVSRADLAPRLVESCARHAREAADESSRTAPQEIR